MGLSVDSVPCLKAWADSLGGITYPLLSDFYPHGGVAQAFGVLREEGYTERAIFVIDKQGVIRYVDVHDIDRQPDNDELFRVLQELEPDERRAYFDEGPFQEPEGKVVMYCTPWCPDCRQARRYFEEQGIDHVEVDISVNRSAARLVREWAGGQEITPTFRINGRLLVDYDLEQLEAALKEIE